MLLSRIAGALNIVALAPDPFKPNTDDVPSEVVAMYNKLLGFVTWTVTGLCVAGIMIVAGRMAVAHRRGEGGEHATGLAWVGGACLLVGTATPIITAIMKK
ncbi:hypothetical protein [Actinomadura rayongensis]|uniref:Conjugal transfer protein TrbC n=1 Tax=Actinomadura rayongensis TaxID=1429076 RepID=A0A6I4W846_9ACTN|nr:hypothetical protein [Actinomadura rayongensis]MXQ65641.1 hypothetical protein [Actinomadura rayongensis]